MSPWVLPPRTADETDQQFEARYGDTAPDMVASGHAFVGADGTWQLTSSGVIEGDRLVRRARGED